MLLGETELWVKLDSVRTKGWDGDYVGFINQR